jgi:hypothetical protein
MSMEALAKVLGLTWGFAPLSWKYFFVVPVVFSGLITLCSFCQRGPQENRN